MTTKFDQVVKLKKINVDKIENELGILNSKIEELNHQKEVLLEELSEFKYPEKGVFSIVLQIKELMKLKRLEIKRVEEELEKLKLERETLKIELKNRKLDYEKIKYLQGEEIKKILKKIKKMESKEMDEIALMLFKDKENE